MKNKSKSPEQITKEVNKIHEEIQPALYEYSQKEVESYALSEKDLNSKILEITAVITDRYPELLNHLNEMPVTIPTEKRPEITIKNLQGHYDSLNSILTKYEIQHSENIKNKKEKL